MLSDFGGFSRLSLTLRFNSNNELDTRSRQSIARLATALKEAEFAGKRVLLAGFTDVSGRFPSNMVLGSKRAAMARTAVLTAAGPGLDQRLVAGAVEDEQRGHARAKQGLYAVEAEVDVAVFCWFGWFVGGRSWGGGERVGGGFWRGGG